MTDLSDRLRALDEVPPPDLWPSIQTGTATRSIPGSEPTIRKRLLVTALALGVTGVAVLSVSRWVGSSTPERFHPAERFHPRGHRVVVSAVSKDGTLRCTATLPGDQLQPGLRPGVRFTLSNLSRRPVLYSGGTRGRIIVKDPSGRVLWDPVRIESLGHGGPYLRPLRLRAGTTETIPTFEPTIWWGGHVTLDLSCLGLSLGSIPVRVFEPGPAPPPGEALDRALARTGGLFDRCRPASDGSWTRGIMLPPDGADVPPLRVRCSAHIVRHPGFAAVAITFVSPSDAPAITFPDDIYQLSNIESLPGTGSIEAGRWLFVVTRDAVREVSSLDSVFRLRGGDAMAPEYAFEQAKWSRGGTSCDSEGYGGGVLFLSVCP